VLDYVEGQSHTNLINEGRFVLKSLVQGIALGIMVAMAGSAHSATIIARGEVFETGKTLDDPRDLWVTPADFERISGFTLKPEGACLDDLCIPILQDADNALHVTREGQAYINATAFANAVQQAYAVDHESGVWSFGLAPATRKTFLESAMAPDFALKDRAGNTIRLSDFRNKKVLILSWASW
jgi:hypothetical protein